MRLLLACLLLSCWTAPLLFAQEKNVTIGRPSIAVSSPLYTASIDVEYRMLSHLECVVHREDVVPDEEDVERNWWTPKELQPHCLEDADYVGSGLQRGHVRALLWSRGSPSWPDVNMTGVIVPEYPEVNNGPIRNLESHVADLARDVGQVQVSVTMDFSKDVRMSKADEPHRVPSAVLYDLSYQKQKQPVQEHYRIPNRLHVDSDFHKYVVN